MFLKRVNKYRSSYNDNVSCINVHYDYTVVPSCYNEQKHNLFTYLLSKSNSVLL